METRLWSFRFVADPEPVLTRDEFRDALNPSVAGRVNLYSVYDGQWHTALATSEDGVHWQKQGIVLRAAPGSYIAANGSALSHAGPVLVLVRDRREGPAAHLAGALGGCAHVARGARARARRGSGGVVGRARGGRPLRHPHRPYFYLYYLGQDRAVRQRIGVARSSDGVHWEKLRANPVLEMDEDEAGIGEPAVWQSHGFYWMLYTVRDFAENRYLRLARSTDGVHWTKLAVQYRGTQAWNSKVICDPTVVVEGDRIQVWFGGGDVASPDENLHGQIGFATLAK